MDRRRFDDLLAAYALGALPEDEVRKVEEYLAAHPERQAEVDELRSVADLLALAPEELDPPPELRQIIIGAAEPETEAREPETSDQEILEPESRPTSEEWREFFSFPRLAFAASTLVVVAGLLLWNLALQGEVRDLQGRIEDTPEAPRIHELRGSGVARAASGQVMEVGDSRVVLIVEDLPRAPQNKTYQIWLIEGDAPKPSGVFEPGNELTAAPLDKPLDGADIVAVTVEPEGGSPAPTSAPILTSKL